MVTGCYATRRPDELRALPNVVRVVGNDAKESIVSALDADGELTTAQRFDGAEGPCGMALAPGVAGRTALTLRVQTGCDEECSYCIIPRTRGAGRSRPLGDVLRDVRRAVDAGYREIAITGVHLGSYGRDLRNGTTLTSLVRQLADWPDDVLFRVSSLEPMDCTPEIVAAIARSPRIAPALSSAVAAWIRHNPGRDEAAVHGGVFFRTRCGHSRAAAGCIDRHGRHRGLSG